MRVVVSTVIVSRVLLSRVMSLFVVLRCLRLVIRLSFCVVSVRVVRLISVIVFRLSSLVVVRVGNSPAINWGLCGSFPCHSDSPLTMFLTLWSPLLWAEVLLSVYV